VHFRAPLWRATRKDERRTPGEVQAVTAKILGEVFSRCPRDQTRLAQRAANAALVGQGIAAK
jgi:hypothetical protein